MWGEHRYSVRTTWTGDRGTGTSGYRDYDRSVTLEIDGKPAIAASADRPFRGDRTRWNPEDMLLAALSECHLLSYLHACVKAGAVDGLTRRNEATVDALDADTHAAFVALLGLSWSDLSKRGEPS